MPHAQILKYLFQLKSIKKKPKPIHVNGDGDLTPYFFLFGDFVKGPSLFFVIETV